jgi:TatD DNase family protein
LGDQLDAVLTRASAAGVLRMLTIGTNLADDEAAIAVCRGRTNLRCAIGIHPNYCHEIQIDAVQRLRELQLDSSVVALGEMGLDYFRDIVDRPRQKQFFEAQLALAKDLNRPIVIHSREAIDDTLAILKNVSTIPAVFHSFTGTAEEASRIIEAGYLIGFTGPVTYKKNDALREVVKYVPHDRLLVETDAPYLSPEPMRKQKTNEPALVVHIAAMVARQWGVSVEEVDRMTTENFRRFFRWA